MSSVSGCTSETGSFVSFVLTVSAAGESVSRARRWIPAGVVSLIVGREGCVGVAAGPVVSAGPVVDCGVVAGVSIVGGCGFVGESLSRARRCMVWISGTGSE